MDDSTQIEIQLSKSKLTILLIGSLVFVIIGIWLLVKPPGENKTTLPTIVVAGFASILFFGACAFFILRKMAEDNPGLIINDSGITDNSSGVAAGEILWSDITEISVIKIQRQKLIMIHIKNPRDYIEQQTSAFKRKAMQWNYEMYGTPLSISTNGLKISFDELRTLLNDKLNISRI